MKSYIVPPIEEMSQPASSSQGSAQEFLSQETFNNVWADMSKMFTTDLMQHGNEFNRTALPIQYNSGHIGEETVEINVESYMLNKPEMMNQCLPTSQAIVHHMQPNGPLSVQCSSNGTPAIYTAPAITYPEHVNNYENQNGPMPNMNPIAQTMIPTNTDFAGDYGFEIGFQSEVYPPTKSVTWTYSEKLKKLFVKLKCLCPIKFKTRVIPPGRNFIRATVVFKKPEHYREIVQQCPNHITKFKSDNHPAPNHLMRCENSNTAYETCQQTGRHSLRFPFNPSNSDYLTEMFQFLCFSSCPGGLNRRPIQVVFMLENNNRNVGQCVLDLRICACSGRDRMLAEKAAASHGDLIGGEEPIVNGCDDSPDSVSPSNSKPSKKRTIGSVTTGFQVEGVTTTTPVKRVKVEEEEEAGDDEIYTIQVRGRKKFELLLKIKDGLEIMDRMPEEIYKSYLSRSVSSEANGTCIPQTSPGRVRETSAQGRAPSPNPSQAHEVNESMEEERDVDDIPGTPPSSQLPSAFPYSQLCSQGSNSSSSQASQNSSQTTQSSACSQLAGEIQAIKFTLRRTISLGSNGLPINRNGIRDHVKPSKNGMTMGKKIENLLV